MSNFFLIRCQWNAWILNLLARRSRKSIYWIRNPDLDFDQRNAPIFNSIFDSFARKPNQYALFDIP